MFAECDNKLTYAKNSIINISYVTKNKKWASNNM